MLQAKINQCSLSNMMYLTDVTSIEQNIANDISHNDMIMLKFMLHSKYSYLFMFQFKCNNMLWHYRFISQRYWKTTNHFPWTHKMYFIQTKKRKKTLNLEETLSCQQLYWFYVCYHSFSICLKEEKCESLNFLWWKIINHKFSYFVALLNKGNDFEDKILFENNNNIIIINELSL